MLINVTKEKRIKLHSSIKLFNLQSLGITFTESKLFIKKPKENKNLIVNKKYSNNSKIIFTYK